MYYTNREVNDHNGQKVNKVKSKQYQPELVGDYPKEYKHTITAHRTVDNTNLSQFLNIKTEARVMIFINVSTADSLVNGSLGVIEDIIT